MEFYLKKNKEKYVSNELLNQSVFEWVIHRPTKKQSSMLGLIFFTNDLEQNKQLKPGTPLLELVSYQNIIYRL